MTNHDSRAQEALGSSAIESPSSVESPARDPFDEMTRLANRALYKAEMCKAELEMVQGTLRQILRAADSAEHPVACLARGHLRQIQRLLERLEAM